jgi:O-antigen/teichoic acid export membrane protein
MKNNIIANFIGKFWSVLSNFLFIPLYIHYLGFESFSIISFTLMIGAFMAFLDGGLTATLSREFARLDNSQTEKIRIFKTLEFSYFIITFLCIAILYVLSDLIAFRWLNLNNFKPEKVSFFIKIISFGVGFQMLLRFYMGGLLGLEKQIKANIFQISWGIARNGLVVVVILFFPSLEVFFIWQTLSTVIFAVVLKFTLNKYLTGKYVFDLMPKFEKAVFKNIWRFAGGMLLISLVASLNSQMDKLAISKFLSLESLGYYTLAVSLSMTIYIFTNPISVALLPRLTALYSKGNCIAASLLFSKVNIFIGIIVFAMMANILFFAENLIWIWTGNLELAQQSHTYLSIVSISYSMLALAIFPYNVAIANGYTKLNNLMGLISLFFTLPGYWIGTKFYGGVGAVSVFCIVQILVTFIYVYFIKKKFLFGLSFKSLYVNQMIYPALISLTIAYVFSSIPSNILFGKIETLLWIGFSTIVTIIISTLLLIPLDHLKKIVFFIKNKSI